MTGVPNSLATRAIGGYFDQALEARGAAALRSLHKRGWGEIAAGVAAQVAAFAMGVLGAIIDRWLKGHLPVPLGDYCSWTVWETGGTRISLIGLVAISAAFRGLGNIGHGIATVRRAGRADRRMRAVGRVMSARGRIAMPRRDAATPVVTPDISGEIGRPWPP